MIIQLYVWLYLTRFYPANIKSQIPQTINLPFAFTSHPILKTQLCLIPPNLLYISTFSYFDLFLGHIVRQLLWTQNRMKTCSHFQFISLFVSHVSSIKIVFLYIRAFGIILMPMHYSFTKSGLVAQFKNPYRFSSSSYFTIINFFHFHFIRFLGWTFFAFVRFCISNIPNQCHFSSPWKQHSSNNIRVTTFEFAINASSIGEAAVTIMVHSWYESTSSIHQSYMNMNPSFSIGLVILYCRIHKNWIPNFSIFFFLLHFRWKILDYRVPSTHSFFLSSLI